MDNLWTIYGYGWWYTYPSEKYDSVGMIIPNIFNIYIYIYGKISSKPPTSYKTVYLLKSVIAVRKIWVDIVNYILLLYILMVELISWWFRRPNCPVETQEAQSRSTSAVDPTIHLGHSVTSVGGRGFSMGIPGVCATEKMEVHGRISTQKSWNSATHIGKLCETE